MLSSRQQLDSRARARAVLFSGAPAPGKPSGPSQCDKSSNRSGSDRGNKVTRSPSVAHRKKSTAGTSGSGSRTGALSKSLLTMRNHMRYLGCSRVHLVHKCAKRIARARFGCIQIKAGRTKTSCACNTHMKCSFLFMMVSVSNKNT